jgi:hypothetical protein
MGTGIRRCTTVNDKARRIAVNIAKLPEPIAARADAGPRLGEFYARGNRFRPV